MQNVIANLLKNWKTTSAGLVMMLGAVIHLVFAVRGHTADEATWTASLTAILAGVGLMAAGDQAASAQQHAASTAAIQDLQSKVRAATIAVVTGDSSILTKAQAGQTTTPGPESKP